jgi:hypothetical protein
MASENNLWDEALNTEAALTAYSMSKIFPIVIDNCRGIDGSIATEIVGIFERYSAYTKELTDTGKGLAKTGTKDFSNEEISARIEASLKQVNEFFADPKNRNTKSCEAYKSMLEFDLQIMK